MDINGINPPVSPSQAEQVAEKRADKSELNYDSFLKLFVEALKHQDPMAPMEQSEMMSQLSQLTNMENNMKLTGIVESLGNQLMGSKMSQYASFIGKNVTVQEEKGEVTGIVKMISNENGVITATLDNGEEYEVERLKSVFV